ncbi:MAG: class I SAM-dependent methyltransferase, partial [candidate division Zixibacteria bacterium]|nr:class I SAM-dependent methyltransferase [candidate division Zixibacteria bacterium]
YDESIKLHLNTFPFNGYYKVLSAVISLVNPKRGLKVMDVGIGTGFLSEELNNRGCIIHGVDFSGEMLEKAKLRIPDGLFETVDVSTDHFGNFSNHQYDRVVSSYFFHHLNLRQKTQLIKRTLNNNLLPHGRIIIADVGFEKESDYQAGYIKYQENWDDEEFYLCGESIVSHLQTEKIKADYKQISSCAGILVCRK